MKLLMKPGKEYDSPAVAELEFYTGKDFLLSDPDGPFHGRGTSRHEAKHGDEVVIYRDEKSPPFVRFIYRVH